MNKEFEQYIIDNMYDLNIIIINYLKSRTNSNLECNAKRVRTIDMLQDIIKNIYIIDFNLSISQLKMFKKMFQSIRIQEKCRYRKDILKVIISYIRVIIDDLLNKNIEEIQSNMKSSISKNNSENINSKPTDCCLYLSSATFDNTIDNTIDNNINNNIDNNIDNTINNNINNNIDNTQKNTEYSKQEKYELINFDIITEQTTQLDTVWNSDSEFI